MTLSDYLNLFPGASQDRPRFMQLAEAILQQVMDIQAVIPSLASANSISQAQGAQLDMIGYWFGLNRSDSPLGTDDLSFRLYILNKLALWQWNGSNAEVPEVLSSILPNSIVTDNQNNTVTVSPSSLSNALAPVPAGISRT